MIDSEVKREVITNMVNDIDEKVKKLEDFSKRANIHFNKDMLRLSKDILLERLLNPKMFIVRGE